MKKKLITLAEAIANGLLRIFPRPATIVALFLLALLFIGCGAQKTVTQLVENIRTDTVYINRQQYDSIYIFQERTSDYHRGVIIPNPSDVQPLPDTIYIKDKSIEYRYRMLHDTLKVTERDSIPYEVTITEVKEITRPRTWFDKLCLICFVIVTTSITLYISRIIKGK